MPERKPKDPKPEEILRSGASLPDHYLPQNNSFPILGNPISPIKKPTFEIRSFELPSPWNGHDKGSIGGSLPPADTRQHGYKRLVQSLS